MFDTYTEIFNQRGAAYHQAMMECPHARGSEFNAALSLLDLRPGMALCDVPSGGGYLGEVMTTPNVEIYSVETARAFSRKAQSPLGPQTVLCETLEKIPLKGSVVERVISLAGAHHLESQSNFFKEVFRLLSDGGLFCLADVWAGSGVDQFLNGFVHQHSRMGHQGHFLAEHTLEELQESGFRIESAGLKSYTWIFESPEKMVRYCQMLFGIDRADESAVLAGISSCLGYELKNGTCHMNWELFFVQASKVSLSVDL